MGLTAPSFKKPKKEQPVTAGGGGPKKFTMPVGIREFDITEIAIGIESFLWWESYFETNQSKLQISQYSQ